MMFSKVPKSSNITPGTFIVVMMMGCRGSPGIGFAVEVFWHCAKANETHRSRSAPTTGNCEQILRNTMSPLTDNRDRSLHPAEAGFTYTDF